MKKYDIAAYIWPAYTGDEKRTRIFWPDGDGEWQTVRDSQKNSYKKPKGYEWKRRPLWGYVNEASPEVMEMQIDCAADHGVNVFIYDWYWFDGRPFLENCLNDGYLKAKNNDRVKFYLMWANHHANHLWKVDLVDELHFDVIWRGDVNRAEFDKLVERWISNYFSHPSYYKINGAPVFMIYHPFNFIEGLGGLDKAREAVAYFRRRVKEVGFPDLHLQMTSLGKDFCYDAENGEQLNLYPVGDKRDIYSGIGFDSTSEYQMRAITDMNRDYLDIIKATKKQYDDMSAIDGVLYFPHVSVGWDTNPRYIEFDNVVTFNNTPKNVESAFRQAKEYIDTHPELPAPLITVNSWNEWTETSYLQPDNLYGYGYLEAIKRVFTEE